MLSVQFIEEMKRVLLAKKAQLQEDLNGLKKHIELGDDDDAKVQEVEDDEVSRGLIARIQIDLQKIDKALAKIEDGSYGLDSEGKAIPEERLRALPWADKSIEQN